MRADFRMFTGGLMKSWEDLFREATDFASRLGRERVISISHSQYTARHGMVIVWYWSDVGSAAGEQERK